MKKVVAVFQSAEPIEAFLIDDYTLVDIYEDVITFHICDEPYEVKDGKVYVDVTAESYRFVELRLIDNAKFDLADLTRMTAIDFLKRVKM